MHHRLEQDAEHADRNRLRVRTRRGDGVVVGPQVADEIGDLAANTAAQRVHLGRRPHAFEQHDACRRGIFNKAPHVRLDTHLDDVSLGIGVKECVAHGVEQRSQRRL
jgi:hypothetical protein